MAMASARISDALLDRCRLAAGASGMTLSAWLRQAIRRELERHAREHAREAVAVPGTGNMVSPRLECPHFTVSNATTASCGTCGPLAIIKAGAA